MNLSDYVKELIAENWMNGQANSVPATLYVGLDTVARASDGTGTEVANANAYARVAVTDGFTWSDPQMSNTDPVTFPAASGGSWGTVVGLSIWDASPHGTGNLLYFGQLNASKTIDDGETFAFGAGDLIVSWN